jgi:diaminohydroxyphosphoribosylaminopyrimidine deaminase/5-amino-6-(5-phosphoribosylamino)uracil reductase
VVATTDRAPETTRRAWAERAADVHVLPADPHGGVGLQPLLKVLHECHDVQSVLIEGGPTLAWSAVREGVVDRFVWYIAPKLIGGGGPGSLMGEGIATIADAVRLEIEAVVRVGPDVKVTARPRGKPA